ncbi:MAG: tyrosine-type recombinase/integrase [Patescibacteria group bacterium]
MAGEQTLLSSAQEKFLEYLKSQKRSISTILAYGKDIEQLVSFLSGKKITQVTSITSEHLEEFKEDFSKKGYTLKSISRKLNSVKTFFRFLKSQGLIEEDPAVGVSHPKYEIKPPRILSKMEYRALRDACREDVRMAAIIEIMLQTGIRIGELSRLELPDLKENEIFIKTYQSQPERTIPLNKAARVALDRYLKERPKTKTKSIFVTKTGRPLLVRNIRTTVDRYFRIAGIENAKVNDLRNTWLVHHLASGASVVFLSKIAGHKRLSTTEKYLAFVKEKTGEEKVKLEEL